MSLILLRFARPQCLAAIAYSLFCHPQKSVTGWVGPSRSAHAMPWLLTRHSTAPTKEYYAVIQRVQCWWATTCGCRDEESNPGPPGSETSTLPLGHRPSPLASLVWINGIFAVWFVTIANGIIAVWFVTIQYNTTDRLFNAAVRLAVVRTAAGGVKKLKRSAKRLNSASYLTRLPGGAYVGWKCWRRQYNIMIFDTAFDGRSTSKNPDKYH